MVEGQHRDDNEEADGEAVMNKKVK